MVKNIGILGGSFDPIHVGHLNMAKEALKYLSLDKIYLDPNKCPYYKDNAKVSDNDRINMIKLSINHETNIEISELEINNENYLSTYEVLKILNEKYPDTIFTFIMGMDSFLNLHKWRHAEEIINLANLAVLMRPGFILNLEELPPLQQKLYQEAIILEKESLIMNFKDTKKHKLYLIKGIEVNISSSFIRENLKTQNYDKLTNFLTQETLNYIKEHNLYT